jgi:hypothetical protein
MSARRDTGGEEDKAEEMERWCQCPTATSEWQDADEEVEWRDASQMRAGCRKKLIKSFPPSLRTVQLSVPKRAISEWSIVKGAISEWSTVDRQL